jgi:hypothetical protein
MVGYWMHMQFDLTSAVHALDSLYIRGRPSVASASLQPALLASAEVAVICTVASILATTQYFIEPNPASWPLAFGDSSPRPDDSCLWLMKVEITMAPKREKKELLIWNPV